MKKVVTDSPRRDFLRILGVGAAALSVPTAFALETKAKSHPNVLRLNGEDFTAKLPWFYHNLPFDRWQQHAVYSLEANALEIPAGEYAVALLVADKVTSLLVSFDGTRFTTVPVQEGRAELKPLRIDNQMLSVYLRAPDRHAASPVTSVLVYPAGTPFLVARDTAIPFAKYRRDIRTAEREILREENWEEYYGVLRRPTFGRQELRTMFNDLLAWMQRRQVVDPADVHFGAIYSEEDKYDFRDAAAAAVCFSHAWRDTGDPAWRQRAIAARTYTLKGQHVEDAANRDKYGGFCQMVGGPAGLSYRRLSDQRPDVTGVETCIVINLLARTIELGLEPGEEDLRRLELAAGWVAASEFQPGAFRHHEGFTKDCQASNALAVMALARAHETLDRLGRHPPRSWLDAARRGMRHYLEGQEAIGCWSYHFATIGRGQSFREQSIPDHGMGVYHFLVACSTPAFRDLPGIQDKMQRAARWWLCTSYLDRRGPMLTIDLDDRRAAGGLKFSAFTWNRFMAAASLLRIAGHTGQPEPWRNLARRYMEHVHTKLWNRTDPNTAPVVRATRADMQLQTWIQAAEWDAVLLRDMEERMA